MSKVIELADGSRWAPIKRAESDLGWDHAAEDADRVAALLRPKVGKRVLLFGGGGCAAWVMTLRDVSVADGKNVRKQIRVKLVGRNAPAGGRTFEPLLASWWIAVRMPKKTGGGK